MALAQKPLFLHNQAIVNMSTCITHLFSQSNSLTPQRLFYLNERIAVRDQNFSHLSSSQLSFFFTPPVAPYPPFRIAAVPIALGLVVVLDLSSPAAAKLSQKSFLSGSTVSRGRDEEVDLGLESPSTKRLNDSEAVLVPVWMFWATCAAFRRA